MREISRITIVPSLEPHNNANVQLATSWQLRGHFLTRFNATHDNLDKNMMWPYPSPLCVSAKGWAIKKMPPNRSASCHPPLLSIVFVVVVVVIVLVLVLVLVVIIVIIVVLVAVVDGCVELGGNVIHYEICVRCTKDEMCSPNTAIRGGPRNCQID